MPAIKVYSRFLLIVSNKFRIQSVVKWRWEGKDVSCKTKVCESLKKRKKKFAAMSSKKIDKARLPNGSLKEPASDNFSSSFGKQQRQKEAMQKLSSIFRKKAEAKRQPDSWQSLIKNLLNSQRGKLPLLLAVEAGNQSMVRELLASQTSEQLKVSKVI